MSGYPAGGALRETEFFNRRNPARVLHVHSREPMIICAKPSHRLPAPPVCPFFINPSTPPAFRFAGPPVTNQSRRLADKCQCLAALAPVHYQSGRGARSGGAAPRVWIREGSGSADRRRDHSVMRAPVGRQLARGSFQIGRPPIRGRRV